jgi:quercetin dioxygenase-like cupin family protein
MRLVLQAGQLMPSHRVPGEITLQCLEGAVEVDVAGQVTRLQTGHLMYVRGGVDHALRAVQACAVLVTVVLRASAD